MVERQLIIEYEEDDFSDTDSDTCSEGMGVYTIDEIDNLVELLSKKIEEDERKEQEAKQRAEEEDRRAKEVELKVYEFSDSDFDF